MIDLSTTDRQYLRIDEFVRLSGSSRRTVYYWIATKKLRAEKPLHRGLVIPVTEARRVIRYFREPLYTRPPAHSVQPGAKTA